MEQKAIIISGFPGVGKTQFVTRVSRHVAIDLDSSQFKSVAEYLSVIIQTAREGNYKYVLVSTHGNLRSAMKQRGLKYIIITPRSELKDEYLARYLSRCDDYEFINYLYNNWAQFLLAIERDGSPVIHLNSRQYLSDILLNT